jgi:hypothetical protein
MLMFSAILQIPDFARSLTRHLSGYFHHCAAVSSCARMYALRLLWAPPASCLHFICGVLLLLLLMYAREYFLCRCMNHVCCMSHVRHLSSSCAWFICGVLLLLLLMYVREYFGCRRMDHVAVSRVRHLLLSRACLIRWSFCSCGSRWEWGTAPNLERCDSLLRHQTCTSHVLCCGDSPLNLSSGSPSAAVTWL